MISHLTKPRKPRTDDLTGKHRGDFTFWRQIHRMWLCRQLPSFASIDYTKPQWEGPATDYEMERYCSRRSHE